MQHLRKLRRHLCAGTLGTCQRLCTFVHKPGDRLTAGVSIKNLKPGFPVIGSRVFYCHEILFFVLIFVEVVGNSVGEIAKMYKKCVFSRDCLKIRDILTFSSLIDFSLHVRNRLEKIKRATN